MRRVIKCSAIANLEPFALFRDAIRHKKGEENDESFYFWAIRFFMEFNRLYSFDVGLVSETLSMSVFYSIQVRSVYVFPTSNTDPSNDVLAMLIQRFTVSELKNLLLNPDSVWFDSEQFFCF